MKQEEEVPEEKEKVQDNYKMKMEVKVKNDLMLLNVKVVNTLKKIMKATLTVSIDWFYLSDSSIYTKFKSRLKGK